MTVSLKNTLFRTKTDNDVEEKQSANRRSMASEAKGSFKVDHGLDLVGLNGRLNSSSNNIHRPESGED